MPLYAKNRPADMPEASPGRREAFPLYSGIFLVSGGSLIFEVALIRIFSLSQWYHFAFLSVSVALLGFGASGTFLSFLPEPGRRDLQKTLALLATFFSLSIIGSYLIINNLPFDSYRIAWEREQLAYLGLYYFSLTVPFFFAGLCTGLPLAVVPTQANRIYFFNLAGSGLGCLLVLGLLPLTGAPGTVIFTALLGLMASISFAYPLSRIGSLASILGLGALLYQLFRPPAFLEVKMSPYKDLSFALSKPQTRMVFSRWNAFSRVDVIESPSMRSAPGLSLSYLGHLPPQMAIAIDGDNLSPITEANGNLAFLDYLPTALIHQLSPRARIAIIEPGGGLDVLAALRYDAQEITAIESNPLVAEVVGERFGEFAGGIYQHQKVKVIHENGRSYLRRSNEKFDIVQLSLTDTYRVVASGAYSLSENYLYTTQAFLDYLDHLTDQGMLAVSRWLQIPPSETTRIGALAISALVASGAEDPGQHIVAIRSWSTSLLLVKKSPFTPSQIEVVRRFCQGKGFDPIWFPGIQPGDLNRYNILPEDYYHQDFVKLLSTPDGTQFYKEHPYDISPPTDNKPFFFHFFKWKQIPSILRNFGRTWQPFGGSGYLVLVVLLLAALLASGLLIIPPLFLRRQSMASPLRERIFLYFLLLGLGYLFVEIPLMQRFILFLGHPIYAFATVLFALLVSSGLGSLLSRHFPLQKVMPALGGAILVYLFLLPALLSLLLGQSLFLRVFSAAFILAPLGFLMGIPFPRGIALIGRLAPSLIPWAWGVNGCASVLSSILAAMLALSWGFSWVLTMASLAYLLAWVVIHPLTK